MDRRIPLTELRSLYETLELFSSLKCHLAMAEEATRGHNPHVLAEIFRRSVERFSDYENSTEPFYPDRPPRTDLLDAESVERIAGTFSLTSLLKCQGSAQVVGDSGFDFTFVDRELVPARTTGNARYDNDEPSNRFRRVDWLLVNSKDRVPIIAEVKVGNDRNPFFALIQLLMYAAEFATANQMIRLRRHYPDRFVEPQKEANGESPLLDLYIVLAHFNLRSQPRMEILEAVNQLSGALMADPAVTGNVRRIACLDVTLGEGRQLCFKKVFAYAG